MSNVTKLVGVAALGGLALLLGVRAAAILSVVLSSPQNFLPAARTPDGCPICPPQTFLSGETEQILTMLGSLAVLCLAWLLWLKLSQPVSRTES
jgi:hypothetical protein